MRTARKRVQDNMRETLLINTWTWLKETVAAGVLRPGLQCAAQQRSKDEGKRAVGVN